MANTRNLGAGGAYILCAEPLSIGTRLALTVHVPVLPRSKAGSSTHAIEVVAEVRWHVTANDDPQGAGMGVQFLEIASADVMLLNEYFSSLTGSDPE